MLVHLSTIRFKNDIFDFSYSSDWQYKGKSPAVILFQTGEHLLQKGFRDIYDPLSDSYSNIKFYQVLVDEDPELGPVFGITHYPATVFIPLTGTYRVVEGYLTRDDVQHDIEEYLIL